MNDMEQPGKKNIADILSLTPLQQGMLFHYLKNPDSDLYFEQLSLRLSGKIDPDHFEKAWNDVVEANEMLRVVFRWQKMKDPVQIILKRHRVDLRVYDLSRDESLQNIKIKDRQERFDLREVPFRVTLCKIEEDRYDMIISNHHILFDGWSSGIILSEFFTAYAARSAGKRLLKPEKTVFKEYIRWLRYRDQNRQEKFWAEYLAGFETSTALSLKRSRGPAPAAVSSFKTEMGTAARIKLEDFAQKNNLTLAALFYSAYGILLQKYNNTDDVIFGTTTAGRSAKIKGIEDMVGLFINTLPLRVRVSTGERAVDLLKKINRVLQKREEFETTPLVQVKEYGSIRGSDEIFDSILVMENYPLPTGLPTGPGTLTIVDYSLFEMPHYDLTIAFTLSESIRINFIYNSRALEEEVIERLSRHFVRILEDICENPRTTISTVAMLSAAEKKQLVFDFNHREKDYPVNKTIPALFTRQADKTPDRVALSGTLSGSGRAVAPRNVSITYLLLDEKSDRLARCLLEKGLNGNRLIGIMTGRTIEMVTGILGILKSGSGYLPLNPGAPVHRSEYMLRECAVELLLTTREILKEGEPPGKWHGETLFLEEPEILADARQKTFISPENLAYVIFTSGSTGKPKGVPITHANFCALMHWGYRHMSLDPEDRVVQNLSYYFDWSVWEIFITLTSGARLHMVAEEVMLDPEHYVHFLHEQGITVLHITPTQFQTLTHTGLRLTCMKHLAIGAEKLTLDLARRAFKLVGKNCRVYNMYGPTETTIMAAVLNIDRDREAFYGTLSSIPIGPPIANTDFFIVDRDFNLCPVSVPGELVIGGDGIARGYLNNPEITAEKFTSGRQGVTEGRKLFRTGDVARWLPDGTMEFLGRCDQQVKIRGFRIEPGEVEIPLLEHEKVKEAVVIARQDRTGELYLCAYIVGVQNLAPNNLGAAELREYLSRTLPTYMIPAYFVEIDRIPLNPNGKVNIKALPEPGISDRTGTYLPPEGDLQEALAAIWREVLSLPGPIGIDDHFFESGGHSLKASRLLALIHKAFDVEIPLGEMFADPTIRALSRCIRRKRPDRYTGIAAASLREYYPLSRAQERLFVLQQMDPASPVYNITGYLQVEGEIDEVKCGRVFKELIARHESLRTSFKVVHEEPVQIVHRPEEVDFHIEFHETGNQFVRPFSLSRAPLLRVGLSKMSQLAAASYNLLLDIHHIIADGISIDILTREFTTLYSGGELPPLRLHYKDFALWQGNKSQREAVKEQAGYWLEQLSGELPLLSLPGDFPRPAVQDFKGEALTFEIGQKESRALKALTVKSDATLFMVTLSIFYVFLARVGSQEDIAVGTPAAGRRLADLQNIVGMFVNTLVLRHYPSGDKTFKEFLYEVKTGTLKAFENQDYPFGDLVNRLVSKRDTARNPLFDVMFSLRSEAVGAVESPLLKMKSYEYRTGIAKFDLTMDMIERGENLICSIDYSTSLFRRSTIERYASYFREVLSSAAAQPDILLRQIEAIPEKERKRLLFDFNDTRSNYPRDKTIHRLFEEQASKLNRTAIAVSEISAASPNRQDEQGKAVTYQGITYRECSELSDLLADLLSGKGVRPGSIVALMAESSVELIIALLGILKSGAAYLPVDRDYPEERKRYILSDSGAKLLLTTRDFFKEGEAVGKWVSEVIFIEELKILVGARLSPVHDPGDIAGQPQGVPLSNRHHSPAASLAYIMYTSGSTGRPKGVMVEHRGVVRLVKNPNFIEFQEGKRLLMTGAPVFDITTLEIWGSLLNGLHLYVANKGMLMDGEKVSAAVVDNRITILHLIPQMFNQLLEHFPGMFAGLEYFLVGGDLVRPGPVNRLRKMVNHIKIIHAYGPTENTVFSTTFRVDKEYGERLPIGKPISNSSIYILDKYGLLQPVGVPGELVTGGDGIARGYLNNPELTAEKFVSGGPGGSFHENCLPAPFANCFDNKLYKTGDLARRLPDGNIEFLGRVDSQVKIRGIRIELGEIENRLSGHEKIKEAIVIERDDKKGEKYLCAYIVAADSLPGSQGPDSTELRQYLSASLPSAMIPSFFIFLDRVPVNPNGKIDRKSLPVPEYEQATEHIRPGSAPEKKLVGIWASVLGIDSSAIGVDDNFFEIGGHSLKAATLVYRLHKTFGASIGIRDVFTHPTIRELAARIDSQVKAAYAAIKPSQKKQYYALSSVQKRLYLLQESDKKSFAYNIPVAMQVTGDFDCERLESAVGRLIARHESLRTSFHLVAGIPLQKIHSPEEIEFNIEYHETNNQFIRPFDLSRAPLLRVGLLKKQRRAGEDASYVLTMDMHHIVSDGTSMGIFTGDFISLYTGKELPALRVQYKDFVAWLTGRNRQKGLDEMEAFWLNQFAGEVPVLDLPTDFHRPVERSFAGGMISFAVSGEQASALNILARNQGTTLFMVLLTAYYILLAKLSGQEDIQVGIPASGRSHADLEPVIGMFVNTLVLRNAIPGEESFTQFLARVKKHTLTAFENQDYPYEKLVEKIPAASGKSRSRNPLFDVMFALQNVGIPEVHIPGLSLTPCPVNTGIAKFDLTLMATEKGDAIRFELEYSSALFKAVTIERFISFFNKVLSSALQQPGIKLSEIEILSEEEKKRILNGFNTISPGCPREKTIHELFEKQAYATPGNIAVAAPDNSVRSRRRQALRPGLFLTYRELNRAADRLAALLPARGVRPGEIVGIMVERSAGMIVGILSILKTGAAYLPINPKNPPARNEFMLRDCRVTLLLTSRNLFKEGETAARWQGETLFLEESGTGGTFQGRGEPHVHPALCSPESTLTSSPAGGLAYIIYTSGSTGNPKGVPIRHINFCPLMFWGYDFSGMGPQDRVIQNLAYYFDWSVWEIFITLTCGAVLYIISEDILLNPAAEVDFIRDNKITVLHITPTQYRYLIDVGKKLDTLTNLSIGAEKLTYDLARRASESVNESCRIFNMYGPTEATIMAAVLEIDRTRLAQYGELSSIPIGGAIADTGLLVLDKHLNLCPVKVPGELYIGGAGLSIGYLNNPELTAEKFVRSTYKLSTYSLLYKTGDRVRRLADGSLEFLSRVDSQVKIRGNRIEPGEIENCLQNHTGIKDALVLTRQDGTGESYLCAYIVRGQKTASLSGHSDIGSRHVVPDDLDSAGLRQYLSRCLPAYMVPSYFVFLEKMPLNPNGKVDLKALPEPETETSGAPYEAPRDHTDEKLAHIWAEVLGVENTPGINDNFFDLGGHSLNAAELTSRIFQAFHVEFPLAEAFKRNILREQSNYICQAQKREYSGIAPVEEREFYPLSSAQKRLYFLQQMDTANTAYNMPFVLSIGDRTEKDRFEAALKRLIARHESLRTSFIKINEEPFQRVHRAGEIDFKIEYHEIGIRVGEQDSTFNIQTFIRQFIRPFDLSRAPLVRSFVFRLPGNSLIWLVDIHHIVSDGTSHMILADDFLCFFREEDAGLKPLRTRYRDFCRWQRQWSTGGKIKTVEDYWLSLYSGEIPRLELPTDFKRPEVFTFHGDVHRFELTAKEAALFRSLAAAYGGTLYMNVLAALNALFHRYTGQTDIIIGTGIAGRTHAELQDIIGMFVNTLAMRNRPQGGKTYASFLREVIGCSIEAFENQELQFEELVDSLELERDAARNPLFDVMMVVQNFRESRSGIPGIRAIGSAGDAGQIEVLPFTARFDMTLFVTEENERVAVEIEYYTAIFKRETAARFAGHLKKLIREVSLDPEVKLFEIDILPREEKKEILYRFNDTGMPYPREKTIAQLFEEQVTNRPLHTAVVMQGEHLTYRALDNQANRLAQYLARDRGVRPDQPVGILLDRDPAMMTVILGILKAGGAYVPLSPSYPEERIKTIIDDSALKILVGRKKHIKTLNRLQWECPGLDTILCLDSRDVHAEAETEESELMSRKLWEYVAETAVDEVTGGGWNSSYTGRPIPKEEMDEYGDNILKKVAPLLHKNMRVLEIGAASGISMYRIAPRVGFYYGTDISGGIIEKNIKRIEQEGHRNIKLARLAAHEIDRLEEGEFDLVIINSVVQCFKGHNYLRQVIRKILDLMAEHGHLFIGDIMDQDLKSKLIAHFEHFRDANRGKGYKTKTDWSEELFISRAFWEDQRFDFPEISGMEFSGKIYTIENELTRFRYDVLIRIDKRGSGRTGGKTRHKRQHDLRMLEKHDTGRAKVDLDSANLAYIIYTSGSTGRPKGTLTAHYNVTRVVKNTNYIDLRPEDRVLQLSDYAFDGSVFDIYGALLNGSTLIMIKREDLLEMEILCRLIGKEKISLFFVTTALFNMLADVGLSNLARIRKILFGGERISVAHAARALRFLGADRILHVYGPTETTVYATYFPIDEIDENRVTVPIGSPIANSTVYILDNNLKPTGMGVPGEIYIGGAGVARGYLNCPELTAEKFIRISTDELSTFGRLYKTGDLGRWLPDGSIEFAGRIDQQVKIRGFRIEPGEIENRLRKHDRVKEAVVMDREEAGGEKYLCAYLVGTAVDVAEIRDFLLRSLPGYMVPAHFVLLDRLPLAPTGKVDKKALPDPDKSAAEAFTAARDALEEKLVDLWAEVLHVEKEIIGIDENFFNLGGHSLKATVLTSKIHKVLGVKIPLAEVFRGPTVREMSACVRTVKQRDYTAIRAVEKREYYPLSSAQDRFYIMQRVTPENTAYNMPSLHQLSGRVEKARLETALNAMIYRHESLRTSFLLLDERPVQRIHKAGVGRFSIEDYEELNRETFNRFLRPFDFTRAPLLRLGLIKLAEDRHLLLFDMHHVITDGTSMTNFFREFMILYRDGELAPLHLQYRDFALWQHDRLRKGELQHQEDYWSARFSGELPVLEMPTDFPRPPVQSFAGDKIDFVIGGALSAGIRRLAGDSGVTLNIMLLAVYNVLLSKYTGQEDIIIGTTIAGRFHADLQGIIGLLIETLALRNNPVGGLTFRQFLQEVKQTTLAAYENQAYPFKELIRKVGAENEISRNPVFDAMLIVQNFEQTGFELEGLSFAPFELPDEEVRHMSKVDFTLEAMEVDGEIRCSLEYCTALYRRDSMARLTRHFSNIIREVVREPAIRLSDIAVIDEQERKQLLEEFNNDVAAAPSGERLPLRFTGQVTKTPDRAALVCRSAAHAGTDSPPPGYISLTYSRFDLEVGKLAQKLVEKGIGTDTIVGILLEPSLEMVIAIYAILKSGAAYLPMEPGYPADRISYMLADSGSRLLVTSRSSFKTGEKTGKWDGEVIFIEELLITVSVGRTVPTGIPFGGVAADRGGYLTARPAGVELAYIIYTSGSTGRPKGVLVDHCNLSAYIAAFENEFDLTPADTVVQQVSYAFDASVEEFYPILVKGGKLAVPAKEVSRDIRALCDFIAVHQVTFITCSPLLLNELDHFAAVLPGGSPNPLSSLRFFISGGDRLKAGYIKNLLHTGSVYNTYGPTESTVCATYYRCPADKALPENIPIGSPIHGYRVVILDKYCNLLSIGVPGELCVAGQAVSRGYLNNPELTAEKFVTTIRCVEPEELTHFRPSINELSTFDRLYKTGDLARWLPDGNIEFLGRSDRQVKIRGFRIELAEIEKHLRILPGIKDALVVEKERKSGQAYLAAYVVCEYGEIDRAAIKDELTRQLPDYMIPSYIMAIREIPLTASGKVDRRRLPRPDTPADRELAAPTRENEKIVAGIWQEVLEIERVGLDDNFFDIGGTSLDIFRVNSRINEAFNRQVPVVSMFQYATVRTLSRFLETTGGEQEIAKEKQAELAAAVEKGKKIIRRQSELDVAVIGMAGMFPGSRDIDEFWEKLKNGIEGFAFFTDEELEMEGIDHDTLQNPNYIKSRGIVAGVEYFDNSFFAYTPIEAQVMDPQMRVFTHCVWHALEDAGYNAAAYPGRIGLYAGASANLQWEVITMLSGIERGLSGFMTAQLTDKDFMCTHISYKLDLKGPSYAVQTACSTSLVAVHLAVRGLLHGECEMALAGGVSIGYPPRRGYIYQEGMIFSADGHNRTFDADAKGSVFGDGAGVVLLKRLPDAVNDLDHIYAVIKGTATNNDGIRKVGYTAPSIDGQAEVIRAAQLMAEVEPETISYIEAHGTATPLGDSVEIEALKKAFHTDRKHFCAIGTAKSNVGHLYSAAGITGFIKTALALKHRLIPPSLHFKKAHPQIDFENSPFYVVTRSMEWGRPGDVAPRRAGVSSFGIGGTNAHVILEEAPPQRMGSGPEESRRQKLLLLSAKTGQTLNRLTDRVIDYLLAHPGLDFADAAYTLQVGRKHLPYRRMVVTPALDLKQDAEKLPAAVRRTPIVLARHEKRPVYFLICGQGSQYIYMGIDLYRWEPVFREEIEGCFEILQSITGRDFKEALYPASPQKTFSSGAGKEGSREQAGLIHQTEITQPVLFAFEYALAKLLMSWGIKPDAMIGYSFGEYVAACLGGVFSLEDALNLVIIRGQLTRKTAPGAMISVPLPEKELKPLLKGDLALAIVNGPTCILSGPREAINIFVREMKERRVICVPVNMSHAVHSPMMEPVRKEYEKRVGEFALNNPRIPYVSNVTACWIKNEEAVDPHYWGEHLCSTVRFSSGLNTLLQEKDALFIEIGPGRILGMMVRVHPDKQPGHMIINTVKHPQEKVSDDYFLLEKAGRLWQDGLDIDWSGFYGREKRCRVPLPGYPFTGKRYWIEPADFKSAGGMAAITGSMQRAAAAEPGGKEPGLMPDSETAGREYTAPTNEIEAAIARLWQEQMGIEKIGIHDDFFYLNGSSLVATHILARLQDTYDVDIAMERFYEEPTIAHLAALIKEAGGRSK